MIQVTLPDASIREFPQPVTVAEVAASIGAGLAKAALGGKVNGKLVILLNVNRVLSMEEIGQMGQLAAMTDIV